MRIFFIFSLASVLFFGGAVASVSAQTNFVVCEGWACQACDLVKLINLVIKFLIMISAIIAALLFMYAGFLYVTAQGNMEQVRKATGTFVNVAIGFALMLSAFLIVDTVMKLLVDPGKIGRWDEIQCIATESPTALPPTANGGPVILAPGNGAVLTHAEAQALLRANGVSVVSSGNCSDRTRPDCTSLDGITAEALNRAIAVAQGCVGCNLQITAGTETGHRSSCHQAGTCTDINCSGGCTPSQINQVLQSAAQSGSRAQYEVKTEAEKQALVRDGVPSSGVLVVPWATAPHFSLYPQQQGSRTPTQQPGTPTQSQTPAMPPAQGF